MKIFNWLHPHDFVLLLEFLEKKEDDEYVINIAKNSHATWYHISLIAKLYSQKNIAFVSRDKRIRKLLKQYGFIAFSSMQSISDTIPGSIHIVQENLGVMEYIRFSVIRYLSRIMSWMKDKKPKKKLDIFTVKHSSWYALILGIIVILLLIIGIVSLTSPHATIMITPQISLQNAIWNVVFMSEEMISADTQVPLKKEIFTFETQKKYTVATYDSTKIRRASGKIKIINNRPEALKLKPETRVMYEWMIYRTSQWIEVPAARDSTPGEMIVSVMADAMSWSSIGGSKANIPINTQLVFPWLPPDIHDSVIVTSVEDFTGGEDTFYPLLTEEERKRLESLFREHLLAEVQRSIQNTFNQKTDFIPLPLSEAVVPMDIKVTADQEVWSRETEITLSGKGDFMLYLYNKNILRKMLIKLAQSHLLRGVESYTDTLKPPVIVSVLSTSKDPDPFSIKATAQIEIQVLYDFESSAGKRTIQNMLSDLLWAEKDRVEKTLLNHPYIKNVHIRLTPFWSKKIPTWLDDIKIQVEK